MTELSVSDKLRAHLFANHGYDEGLGASVNLFPSAPEQFFRDLHVSFHNHSHNDLHGIAPSEKHLGKKK